MTPKQRRLKSETVLREHAIPINANLPLIESDEDINLRSVDELFHRIVALWAVAGSAFLRGNDFFLSYMKENDLLDWLSASECEFLLCQQPTKHQLTHASWQLEALYFLAWCGGLIDQIKIPFEESSVGSIMHLFPAGGEDLGRLRAALSLRSVSEVLDWSDMLYCLHWAVRDANLAGLPAPKAVNSDTVMEWHKAVNWMTRYDEEDNWDKIATDT